jgi:hypothetical protein
VRGEGRRLRPSPSISTDEKTETHDSFPLFEARLRRMDSPFSSIR